MPSKVTRSPLGSNRRNESTKSHPTSHLSEKVPHTKPLAAQQEQMNGNEINFCSSIPSLFTGAGMKSSVLSGGRKKSSKKQRNCLTSFAQGLVEARNAPPLYNPINSRSSSISRALEIELSFAFTQNQFAEFDEPTRTPLSVRRDASDFFFVFLLSLLLSLLFH